MSDPRVAPRRHRRMRRAVFGGMEWLAAHLGGRAWYRWRYLAAGRLVVREEVVEVPGLDSRLEGFRVAQLSDLHAGPFLGAGDLSPAVEVVQKLAPDVLVVTGDLCAHGPEDAELVLEDLARIDAPSGAFGVFGNHDYRDRREGWIAERFLERDIRFLRNEGVRLRKDGVELPLMLTGLEDLEEGREIDVEAARQDLLADDVEIMLCHNPRGARVLARPGCAAILSGHTHGTQVDLPWLRSLGPDHPGLRVELGPTTLIVHRGLGVVGAPLRVGAPAEIVLLRLVRAPEARA